MCHSAVSRYDLEDLSETGQVALVPDPCCRYCKKCPKGGQMRNQACIEKDRHKWGICEQVCKTCGSVDLITVKWCESEKSYECYDCERGK